MSPTDRVPAASILLSAAVSSILIVGYVGLWEWAEPGYYLLLVLGTYLSLGGAALWQVVRALRMDDWTRRVGAVGAVVGLAVTIFLGLRPRPACLDAGPCLAGLTPHLPALVLGVALTTGFLFLDLRRRG